MTDEITRRGFMSASVGAAISTNVEERPERFMLTNKLPALTDKNARVARKSFEAFRRTVHPEMLWNPFVLRITRELQEFAIAYEGGKRPKLAFCTPPQHGKSLSAEDFAAWMSGRQPNKKTIYASYSEDLGTRMSLGLQRLMVSRRYREIFPHMMVGVPGWISNTSMTEFARYQGSFRATTINGPVTGLELNLGILDDFAKGRAEAQSKLSRDKTWNWLTDDFLTRFAKDSAFVTTCTRWHIDDVLGRLKKKWPEMRILTFPALAEKEEGWRHKGDPLFPEHKPIEMLMDQKRVMSESSWAAEFQGRPFLSGSGAIPIEKLKVVPFFNRSDVMATVMSVDKAGTEGGDGAFTAIVIMSKMRDGTFVIEDVLRGHWAALERKKYIKAWRLTGFDAPCMHTMYVDKPMRGHGLMQAIARVNRVFRDKPAGLVVDYIGIAQNLKSALGQYSSGDRDQTGIDEAEAIRVLLEKYEIVRAMFRPDTKGGFDYRPALHPAATSQARLAIMAGAIDWVLTLQQADAAKETTDEAKKRAHRRYADAAVALSKAFALAAASDEARSIREEVGFFQAIRAALIKSVPGEGKRSTAERELAIQQIVSRAVVSTEIVDIMKAAGLESPDISILSDQFLAEVSDKKNLAIEALKKLINGDVRSQSKRNVTQSKAFTERLEAAIARYHANALTTAQVLEELIALAKDIRAARSRGEETGLTDEEVAFYDALAENESARQVMGEPTLRVIAQELVTVIKGNVSVDWMHRDSARANIRRHVKRLLRKYGYPPDLQDAAVQNVLQQAEALSADWAA